MAVDTLWGVDGAMTDLPVNAYTQQFDYDGNGNVIYIGWALSSPTPSGVPGLTPVTSLVPTSGPPSTTACWAIKRLTYNGSNQLTLVQWANGNTQMSNVWASRTAGSYQ